MSLVSDTSGKHWGVFDDSVNLVKRSCVGLYIMFISPHEGPGDVSLSFNTFKRGASAAQV